VSEAVVLRMSSLRKTLYPFSHSLIILEGRREMSDPQVSKNGSFRAASLRDNLIAAMSIVALLLAIAVELPATIANTAQWITTREVARHC